MSAPGPPSDRDVVISVTEAAEMLEISASTAKKLAAEGRLPGLIGKLGSQWRVNRLALLNYIERPLLDS